MFKRLPTTSASHQEDELEHLYYDL